ncbi:uncharacterized protein LOC118735377 [Rhagoletis pomonella]|uniref:uncharacterized protein LOC118735377 n=1 Tax=Rhagoletis pomonella TaxID=28610 RepID=UPI00177C028A|nr:uncharacterized protein LOC118735377 [Rhagoletis pomonella]
MNEEETHSSCVNLDRDNAGLFQKVLGLHWDTNNDVLRFVLSFTKVDPVVLAGKRKPTKREVLSVTMSVFDPFGMAGEYTREAKLLIQSTWRASIGWDEYIPEESYDEWLKWVRGIKRPEEMSVPRCYGTLFEQEPVELHIFADASEVAYAAVAYWRTLAGAGIIKPIFIAGKTKCAPLKLTSIPRLELQAAVLATRLRQSILHCHDKIPKRVVMWSDSKTGKSTWIDGPRFLEEDEFMWPQDEVPLDTNEEIRAKYAVLTIKVDVSMFARFSTLIRMTRVVGWILRFRNNCWKNASARIYKGLSATEIRRAEIAIIRAVQIDIFAEEYHSLIAGRKIERSSSLKTLTPVVDEVGVMRLGGRIDAATAIPPHSRRPIILPKRHHVTELIVDYYHNIWKHQNVATIIAEIRRRYWIPQIRAEVRRATKRCNYCKKANPPQMGQLPVDRLTPCVRPFTYVGLDYMGPFTVAIGRRSEKRWIALFTCLTIRAVHLELAKDLSTDTCLMCIRNFMNRRGAPVRIRSDNGTNFVGADKELRRQRIDFENGKIFNALANRNIEWVFNCPLNPHAGGCWERLVRSVKRAMGHALNNDNLQEHCLYSLICEAKI